MNRVLPAFLALVALLAVVAPAAGAGFSVSIPDQTVSPGETVEITPTTENVEGLRIEGIPGEWDVSLEGGQSTDLKNYGDTIDAKWLSPTGEHSLTLGIPDSANGTYELSVAAYSGDEKEIHRTLTITVTEAATVETTTEGDATGGLGGDTVDIETDTPESTTTASGGAATTEEPDADATTDGADERTARASATDTPTPVQSTGEGGPGFGVAAALLALALVARRR